MAILNVVSSRYTCACAQALELTVPGMEYPWFDMPGRNSLSAQVIFKETDDCVSNFIQVMKYAREFSVNIAWRFMSL